MTHDFKSQYAFYLLRVDFCFFYVLVACFAGSLDAVFPVQLAQSNCFCGMERFAGTLGRKAAC